MVSVHKNVQWVLVGDLQGCFVNSTVPPSPTTLHCLTPLTLSPSSAIVSHTALNWNLLPISGQDFRHWVPNSCTGISSRTRLKNECTLVRPQCTLSTTSGKRYKINCKFGQNRSHQGNECVRCGFFLLWSVSIRKITSLAIHQENRAEKAGTRALDTQRRLWTYTGRFTCWCQIFCDLLRRCFGVQTHLFSPKQIGSIWSFQETRKKV